MVTNYCEWPDIPEFARPHFPIVPLAMLEKSVDNLAALLREAERLRLPGADREGPELTKFSASPQLPGDRLDNDNLFGALGRTRTCDPLIRSQPLYSS